MNAPKTLVLSLAMLFVLTFVPTPAAADHNTCAGHNHVAAGVVAGSVNDGESDWWVVSVSLVGAVVLQPLNGDADLEVYTDGCAGPVCSSRASGTSMDRCTLGQGTWRVRVYYFSGPESILYVMAVVADDVAAVAATDAK